MGKSAEVGSADPPSPRGRMRDQTGSLRPRQSSAAQESNIFSRAAGYLIGGPRGFAQPDVQG
jgi:hypothetical protein